MIEKSQQAWQQFWNRTGASSDLLAAIDFPDVSAETYGTTCTRIKQLLQLCENDVVLNIGCGPGLLEKQLASKVKRIVGIDFASVMLEKARLQNSIQHNTFFLQATGTALPFAPGQFNKVLCYSVLHYFSEDEVLMLLRDIQRVASPGVVILLGDIQGEEQVATPLSVDHLWRLWKGGGVRELMKRMAMRASHKLGRHWARIQRRWMALTDQFVFESKPQLMARYPRQRALAMAAAVGFTGEVIEQTDDARFVGGRYNLLLRRQ